MAKIYFHVNSRPNISDRIMSFMIIPKEKYILIWSYILLPSVKIFIFQD